MKCITCGTENLNHAKFCRRCGKPLVDLTHLPVTPATSQIDKPSVTETVTATVAPPINISPPDQTSHILSTTESVTTPTDTPANGQTIYSPPTMEAAAPASSVPHAEETISPQPTDVGPTPDQISSADLRPHPDLPKKTPRSLLWPETRIRLFGGIAGIILGVITSVWLHQNANPQSMLGRMFDLNHFQAVIPIAISSLFFWALLICFLRWIRLRNLERVSSKALLVKVTHILRIKRDLTVLADTLKDPLCVASPLLRRLQAIVQQWLIEANFRDADLVLQQHMLTDEQSVHTGYSLVRTFVWALPVLGLIGTVLGISNAVGGFSQFLGGNVEDVAVIKTNLVNVTGGLSFAFLTTLHGLVTALLIMLLASSLQTREEKLYAIIQQDIADNFLPAIQDVAPEPQAPGSDNMGVWRETLHRIAADVIEKIHTAATQLLGKMDAWGEYQRQQNAAEAQHFGNTLEQSADSVITSVDVFAKRVLEDMSARQESHREEVTASIQIWRQEMATATTNIGKALSNASENFKQAEREFLTPLSAAHEALASQLNQMQSTEETVKQLTRLTDQLLKSQKTLLEAMLQLHDTSFEQTLADFRDSIKALGPTLDGFRKPFVLQAVPWDTTHSE